MSIRPGFLRRWARAMCTAPALLTWAAVAAIVGLGACVGEAPAKDAVRGFRLAEASDSEAGESSFDQARSLYQSRRFAEAGRAYQRAADLDYEAGEAYYDAACSYALAHQTDLALAALGKSLDAAFIDLDLLNDDDDFASIRDDARFQALVDRARHTDPSKARLAAAKERFDKLTSTQSKNEDAWIETGIDLLRTGEPLRAADAFRKAYAVDSSAAQIYNEACALSVAGKTSEALATLERAILAGSGDPDHMADDQDLLAVRRLSGYPQVEELADDLSLNQSPWLDRKRTSAWRRELPHYESIVQKRPVGRAWANLGYARLFAKDANGSVEAYQKALSFGYAPRLTMYNLGCAYAQAGRRDEAITWLERSEKAGFRVGEEALSDEDLDPLRSDPRFQRMVGRWHSAQEIRKRQKAHVHYVEDEDEE